MNRRGYVVSLAVGVALAGGLAAPAAEPEGPDAVIAAVVADNLELQAAAARRDALQQRPGQASAWPNPMLSYGVDVANGMETRYTLEQPVPGLGKRSMRGRLAAANAATGELDYEILRLDLIMEARSRLAELHAARQTAALLREETNLLAQMESVVQARYAAGAARQVEVLKLASEMTLARQKLLKAEQDDLALTSALNQMMNRPIQSAVATAPPAIPPDFLPDPVALWEVAQLHNPDIQRADRVLSQSQSNRSLMRREAGPDWSVGLEYTERDDAENMAMLMVGMELPLSVNRIRGSLREASFMIRGAEADAAAARTRVQSQIQEIGLCCARIQESLALYASDLIPQAEQRRTLSEAGYAAGEVDFIDLLESERFLLGIRMMALQDEAELGMELARLERALGTDMATYMAAQAKEAP